MYEDSKVKFNWKGFLLKLIIVLLVIFLILKLLPFNTKKENNGHTKVFNNNFTSLKEVGNDYFNKDNLPQDNEELKVSLRQLINSKKIKTLKGANRKVCNEDDSYIKSYKKNIGYELEVHLVCGDEEETSYIYLGCFDKCEVNPTTTTTTTTKKSTTKKVTTKNATKKTTTKKATTTTTTTRVKKYAVIFNVNGGSKISTQYVVEGKTANNPGYPSKTGYSFVGWYLDGKEYNFNTPVNSNIILIAKWKANEFIGINITTSKKTATYNQTIYSVATTNYDANSINTKTELLIPTELANKNNVTIKSISYIRNILTATDVNKYLSSNKSTFSYEESNIDNNYDITNFGLLDNIEINRYGTNRNRAIYWNGSVKNTCTNPINNTCAYGILYRVVWEYEA